MTKLEQLLIRACKSRRPYVRLESIIRIFYMTGSKNNPCLIATILSQTSDAHFRMPSYKLTSSIIGMGSSGSMDAKIADVFVRYFRYAKISDLNLPSKPAMFRTRGVQNGRNS